ncbi:MAG: PAS domain-containing protein [Ignavibacteriae bacterium]|nr:PAS domain-containing protein [Ignavibacteriota bacterium]
MKNTLNYSYFDLDIISKFESFEEFPNTKPVILSNGNGLILYANNSARIKHKFKEGKNLFDFNSEPDLESLFNNLTKNKISSFSTDFVIKEEDNYYSGYLLNIEKVIIKNEDVFIVYIESQDNRTRITKKINSYNQALESVNVGVMLADKNASINYLSTSFEDFLHKNIEELYNKNLIDVFKKYLSAQEINELQISVDHYKNWVKVISDISHEGEVLYKEIRLNTVQDNIDKSISFIVTANDITEHIRQARLLKISEQKQKSIINNISDPILILRKEKNNLIFENANNSFYKNILAAKNEINPEAKIQNILSEELFNSINHSITNLNNSNRIHSQFHFTSHNNKRFLGKITFTDDNSDHIKLFIISMTDITEQLEIERKLRDAYKKEISLNKLKSTFLANMSHEIRTPLNAIVGYSDLLEDDVKAKNFESSSQMTTYLKEGVNRLLKLVDNIVEVSLLESGNEEIELTEIELNSLINSNKDYWCEQAKPKSINFIFNLSEYEIFIYANEEKLIRAINEIVDNAIKFSNEKGRIIIATSEKQERGKINITDFGVGIESNNLKRILHIFEQSEDVGYTRKYEGAGLGLSLANKLISYMKGELKITSELTKGTSVKIILPKQ